MHGCPLSLGLHRGRQVQTLLAERAYADVGEERKHGHKNCGEISPGELRCSGTCNQTRVDISKTRHLGYGRHVCRSGENDPETFLPRLLFGKKENLSPIIRALSTMPFKKSEMGLLNPVASAQEKYLTS